MSTVADPIQLVTDYLRTMERRDLAAAQAMLAPGFYMVFPGGKRFDSLEALVESSKGRYRRAAKKFDRFDVASGPDGTQIVYCLGTLYGELLDGSPYEGIRYIDRFTIKDGRFVDQFVWNDMAEVLRDGLGR
jgi:hypothetical protein